MTSHEAEDRLDLEALDVAAFATAPRVPDRGTVKGHECSESTCFQIMCTCTDEFGNCVATNVGCDSSGSGSGGTNETRDPTCATGFQIQCSCP